jgi:ferritin-like metal-binding protein YciE
MKKTPGESGSPPHHRLLTTELSQAIDDTSGWVHAAVSEKSAPGLRQLFINHINDIYWIESQQVPNLSRLISHITSDELIDVLAAHRSMTELQMTRCEEIFAALGELPATNPSPLMCGFFEAMAAIVADETKGQVCDARILLAVQQLLLYEVATYRTLITWSRQLGEQELANMLEDSLSEETQTDERLSIIATAMFRATNSIDSRKAT